MDTKIRFKGNPCGLDGWGEGGYLYFDPYMDEQAFCTYDEQSDKFTMKYKDGRRMTSMEITPEMLRQMADFMDQLRAEVKKQQTK